MSEIKQTILNNPIAIGHRLGFTDLTELHNDWLKSVAFGSEDETILGHRGSYKTTVLSLGMALLMVTCVDDNIIFLRKTDNDVKEVIRQVSKILQSKTMLGIAKDLHPNRNLKLTESNATSISTNLRTYSKGQSQLFGLGSNASITGKHAEIVITDDIVNLKDRVSRAERDRIKRLYMELQNIKNRGGRIFNTGTPWHKEDAITDMPNVRRFDCYQTGLISKAELEEIRSKMTPSLFAANYELKHIASEDVLFSNPQYTSNVASIYNGLCHIDAAYGGEDSTAFTVLKRSGDKIVMFGKKWSGHVDNCLPEIYELKKKYRAGTIHCENNADKGYLKKELIKSGQSAKDYHESTNKYVKIASYLRKNWSNIEWLEDTDPEYMSEILDYTENAEHDDCPDSAASIIRETEKARGWNRPGAF